MALLKIDGVDRSSYVVMTSGIHPYLRKTYNNRSELTLTLKPGLIPDRLADVQFYKADGETVDFGGIVLARRVYPAIAQKVDSLCEITCVDYLAFADYITVSSLIYTTQTTPEAVLEDLVDDYLATHGFTYTAASTGKTIEPFEIKETRLSDVLRRIVEQTGLILTSSPAKVLTLEAPGTDAAPWAVTDANMHATGFEWEDPIDIPATRVVVRCGPQGPALTTQRWVADGSATSWVTDIPAIGQPALVMVDDGDDPFLATVGAGGMFEWSLTDNAPYGTLKKGTINTPANGVKLVLGPKQSAGDAFTTDGFLGVYPFDMVADSEESPTIERVVRMESVISPSEGQALADQLLASESAGAPPSSITTTEGEDIEPGQSLSVDVSNFGSIDDTFVIEAVEVAVAPTGRTYTLQLNDSDRIRSQPIDEWRGLLGGGDGGAVSLVVGGSSGAAVSGGAFSPIYLGGTPLAAIPANDADDWVDIYGAVPHVAQETFTGRCRGKVWAYNASTAVRFRLYNATDAEGTEGSSVTSQTPSETSLIVTITKGKRYVPQVKRMSGSGDIFADGWQLERAG